MLLDWGQAELNQQSPWIKAEFCLLASLTNPNHPAVANLTFANRLYHTAAQVFLPSIYESAWDESGYETSFEKPYILAKRHNQPLPVVTGHEHPIFLAHQIFFESDFGQIPITVSAEIIQQMTSAAYECDNADWVGECILALKCAGAPIPTDRLAFVENWVQNTEPDWSNYHAFLVYELYQALL